VAVVLPVRMGHYAEVSRQIRVILERFTPLIEPLSLDEAFLDVRGSVGLFGSAEEIGRKIKREIASELALIASVGVAPNKFLAKIASDLEKPDGFVVVDPERIHAFLDPLPVSRIWGVGKVTAQSLERFGIRTIAQLRAWPREELERSFGQASGEHFWRLANGIDDRAVVPDRQAKSISNETTFPTDIREPETVRAWALDLAEHVARRLRQSELRGRTVELKIRFHDFRTVARSKTLPVPSDTTQEIQDAIRELIERLPRPLPPVRLVGAGVSGIVPATASQQMLPFEGDESKGKQQRLDAVLDQIHEKFGGAAVARGSSPRKGRKRP
jgi:DNA polymerase-4